MPFALNSGPTSVAMAINFATGQKLTPLQVRQAIAKLPGGGYAANTASGTAQPTDRISIDEFMKIELRTAKVIAAEAVPKSKKLVKLQVDVGTEQRTILAGIAEAYQPESLVGRTVVIVANLKPAKLMGIESNGMVLAASPEGGQPVLLTVDADPGWRVR